MNMITSALLLIVSITSLMSTIIFDRIPSGRIEDGKSFQYGNKIYHVVLDSTKTDSLNDWRRK
jgi:hypothetical protein